MRHLITKLNQNPIILTNRQIWLWTCQHKSLTTGVADQWERAIRGRQEEIKSTRGERQKRYCFLKMVLELNSTGSMEIWQMRREDSDWSVWIKTKGGEPEVKTMPGSGDVEKQLAKVWGMWNKVRTIYHIPPPPRRHTYISEEGWEAWHRYSGQATLLFRFPLCGS